MSTTAANQARAAALKAARAKDSELKRRRALAALEALEATGASITFTAVAKAAGVSTWLVYADGIREHIDAARHRQSPPQRRPQRRRPPASTPRHRPACAPTWPSPGSRSRRCAPNGTNSSSACACNSVPRLEAPDRAHLTARVADLEAINRQLVAERDARTIEADTAKGRVAELEDELSAARESLRRVIKSQNRAP